MRTAGLSTLCWAVFGQLLPASCCICRRRSDLESEIIDLFESPDVAVFSGRLLEPIQSYSGMQFAQTFQDVTAEITHVYSGNSILQEHIQLSKAAAATEKESVWANVLEAASVITTHTQTSLCGASFDDNTPIGTSLIFVLHRGSLSVPSCGVSCMSNPSMPEYAYRQCTKTQDLLQRFEDASERRTFMTRSGEPWIVGDTRPPRAPEYPLFLKKEEGE